jgi:hypothetical protein
LIRPVTEIAKENRPKMSSSASSSSKRSGLSGLRQRISGRKKDKSGDSSPGAVVEDDDPPVANGGSKEKSSRSKRSSVSEKEQRSISEEDNHHDPALSPTPQQERTQPSEPTRGRGSAGNVFQKLRERSRSRSRASERARLAAEKSKEMLVAVTSCRSDGYYNQKAPGSTSKLPRRAPTNLKLFHELAVGVKDAYAAVGATPKAPTEEEKKKLDAEEVDAKTVLWDFIGNLDFVSVTNRMVDYMLSDVQTSHPVFANFVALGIGR